MRVTIVMDWECGDEDDDGDDYEEEDGDMIKMKMIKMTMTMLTSSCPSGGRLMFLTLSRMICRIVFRKAFRNSDVLEQNDEDEDNGHDFHDYQIICRETFQSSHVDDNRENFHNYQII